MSRYIGEIRGFEDGNVTDIPDFPENKVVKEARNPLG